MVCKLKTVEIMEYIPFNINNQVKVKLTDFGRQKLADINNQYAGLYKSHKIMVADDFKNNEDKDGYTTFQMHQLMSDLGEFVGICSTLPFETEILIINK